MDTNIQKFQEQMDCFLNFLSRLFDADVDINSNISLARTFNKTNPRRACEMMYQYISKYETEINECNQSFFVALSVQKQHKFQDLEKVIGKIREQIDAPFMNDMSQESPKDTNKQRIWKYIKALLFLSKRACAGRVPVE